MRFFKWEISILKPGSMAITRLKHSMNFDAIEDWSNGNTDRLGVKSIFRRILRRILRRWKKT